MLLFDPSMSALPMIETTKSQSAKCPIVHPPTGNISWVKTVVRQVSFTLLMNLMLRQSSVIEVLDAMGILSFIYRAGLSVFRDSAPKFQWPTTCPFAARCVVFFCTTIGCHFVGVCFLRCCGGFFVPPGRLRKSVSSRSLGSFEDMKLFLVFGGMYDHLVGVVGT